MPEDTGDRGRQDGTHRDGVRQQGGRRDSPFVLRVRGDDGRLRVYPLRPGAQRVGSLDDNDVVLPFPGVSRRHALMSVERDRVAVEDLASKNGLWIDGERRDRAELTAGSRLLFGTTEADLDRASTSDRVAIRAPERTEDGSPAAPGAAPSTHRRPRAGGSDPDLDLDPATLELAARLVAALPARPAGPWTPFVEELARTLGAESLTLEVPRQEAPLLLARVGEVARPGKPPAVDGSGFRLSGPPRWSAGAELCARFALRIAAERRGDGRQAVRAGRPAIDYPPDWVIGSSPAMHRLYGELAAVAPAALPVLLVGETGVGKEGVARLLHANSKRRGRPFVPVNCAAIPESLLEAELFGVARAVATGVAPRRGQLEQADGGTLLLDEVGDMVPGLQAKLLRVLQDHQIRPLGGDPRAIDVRIVAATNADLERAMAGGAFRADLYYRLAGARLRVPPLRERREDVPALAEHFFLRACADRESPPRGLSRGLVDRLAARPWPGNVRELEHEIERLVLAASGGEVIGPEEIGPEGSAGDRPAKKAAAPRDPAATGVAPAGGELPTLVLERLERDAIQAALAATEGNRTRAARLLGVSRSALRRRLHRLGLGDADPPAGSDR